jgi:hypothetical protein
MTEPKQPKRLTKREECLRAALRENLKRRKLQARRRAAASVRPDDAAPAGPKAGDRRPKR